MTIKTRERHKKITIDLDGPDGNAFVILGIAKRLSNQLVFDFPAIQAEMQSSDYVNLIKVFEHHFGFAVDLETDNFELRQLLNTVPENKAC